MPHAIPTAIRPARGRDLGKLIAISRRTIRAAYGPFMGVDKVEGWVNSGSLDAFVLENLTTCRVLQEGGGIVGFAVAGGDFIDLMLIDCARHREGLGRRLMADVEADLFRGADELRLESYADNDRANSFYLALGWTPGAAFPDEAAGVDKIPFRKRKPRQGAA